nr:hypothetical protein [Tsukamurella asaccharolytica]
MPQPRQDVGLPQKSRGEARIGAELRAEQLQRVLPRQARVLDEEDLPHPTRAEPSHHPVPGDLLR